MGLNYANLDQRTRELMLAEIDLSIPAGGIYVSSYLTEQGEEDWVGLLSEAAKSYSDDWIAEQLAIGQRLKQQVQRRKPKGGYTYVDVPHTAPQTLAEGEFNRFYIRAVCRRAIEVKIPSVVVYRARHSDNPRPESETLIGKHLDPHVLLKDLRENPGVEAALGLAKPNSGLSVKLP